MNPYRIPGELQETDLTFSNNFTLKELDELDDIRAEVSQIKKQQLRWQRERNISMRISQRSYHFDILKSRDKLISLAFKNPTPEEYRDAKNELSKLKELEALSMTKK